MERKTCAANGHWCGFGDSDFLKKKRSLIVLFSCRNFGSECLLRVHNGLLIFSVDANESSYIFISCLMLHFTVDKALVRHF